MDEGKIHATIAANEAEIAAKLGVFFQEQLAGRFPNIPRDRHETFGNHLAGLTLLINTPHRNGDFVEKLQTEFRFKRDEMMPFFTEGATTKEERAERLNAIEQMLEGGSEVIADFCQQKLFGNDPFMSGKVVADGQLSDTDRARGYSWSVRVESNPQ